MLKEFRGGQSRRYPVEELKIEIEEKSIYIDFQ